MTVGQTKLNKITLNFFYRDNNPDCQITRRAIYDILDNYLDKITMKEINFDQNKAICESYKVYGIPTLLIMKDNKVLNRYSGILDSDEIRLFLEPVINNTSHKKKEKK